jgi:hypothetical protein
MKRISHPARFISGVSYTADRDRVSGLGYKEMLLDQRQSRLQQNIGVQCGIIIRNQGGWSSTGETRPKLQQAVFNSPALGREDQSAILPNSIEPGYRGLQRLRYPSVGRGD